MSTQVNTYVMFGFVLDYDEARKMFTKTNPHVELFDFLEDYMDSAFDDKINPKDDISVLYDGRDGVYIAAGHVIAKSGNYEGFASPIQAPTRVSSKILDSIMNLVSSLGYDPNDLIIHGKLGCHIISHYR